MKLVFATHNNHKLKEVQLLLPKYITLLSLTDINCLEEIPETAATLEGNAIIKANYVTKHYGLSCFADDTGLLVESLNGAPGVHTARYAGVQKNAKDNMDKLLKALKGKEKKQRTAYFKTIIALNLATEQHLFEGIVKGHIAQQKSGEDGFGYDPIFIPNGYTQTFAQIPLSKKNSISHRARAMQQLIHFLKNK